MLTPSLRLAAFCVLVAAAAGAQQRGGRLLVLNKEDATFVIVKVVDVVLGLRVKAEEEEMGLDMAVHGEVAYQS